MAKKEKISVKKRVIIICSICLVLLIGAILLDRIYGKSYFVELKYDDVMEKVNNKEDFVLCISQTTCSHCQEYKPKLENVANKYRVNLYYIEVDQLKEEEYNKFKSLFSFNGTPTTLFLIDGVETTAANRINGTASQDKIIKKLIKNGFLDKE